MSNDKLKNIRYQSTRYKRTQFDPISIKTNCTADLIRGGQDGLD